MIYQRTALLLLLTGFLMRDSQAMGRSPLYYQKIPIAPIQMPPINYQVFTLNNGIEVVVVEDREVPIVEFYCRFKAPLDPPDKVGLAEMAAWVLRNGGAESVSADSINRFIEYTSSQLEIYTSTNELFIWGQSLTDNIPSLFSLLHELVYHPALPLQTLELKRVMMLEQIKRESESPFDVGRSEFMKLLYPDHPWGQKATTSTVTKITLDDVREYIKATFTADEAVIGFSGDLTLSEARGWAQYLWEDLIHSGVPKGVIPPPPPSPQAGVYYIRKDLAQAFIYAGHRTIPYQHPLRIAAEVMNYIFGGGGFQSWITRKIRVESGLAYSVGSRFTTPLEGDGQFRMAAQTRINQSGQTLTLMRNLLTQFIEEGPSEEEFQRAKEAFINSYVWEFESSREILTRLVWLKSHHLPLDTYQKDLQAYHSLTLKDVRRAAKELLHPEHLIILVLGDRERMDRPLEDFGVVHMIEPTDTSP